MSPTAATRTPSPLDDQLLAILVREVARAGLGIAPNCLGLLGDMAKEGVKTVGTSPSRQDVEKATKAFTLYVGEMIKLAKKQGDTQLHESIFDAIRRKLCPLWPFC